MRFLAFLGFSIRKVSLFLFLVFLLAVRPLAAEEPDLPLTRILREEGIKTYKVAIHLQDKDWLIQEFGPGDPYPINLTLATKNVVWQAREQIRKGELAPVQGIIRTFWYTNVKPVFARTGSLKEDVEQSDILHEVLVKLVRERDIMRYKNMGFLNNNDGTVKIGKNWHVMLIGEKHGKYSVLEKIAYELKATVFTLGGQPSLLSMEYLVDDYKTKGTDIRKSLYLIFVVDYDPAGWIIRDSVVTDLKFYGMTNIKAIDVILPDILTKKELELAQFPLPKNRKSLNDEWIKKSGGINGKPFGFESDSVPFEKLRNKIIEIATPYVGNPEIIRRANAAEELAAAIDYLVQTRLSLGNER